MGNTTATTSFATTRASLHIYAEVAVKNGFALVDTAGDAVVGSTAMEDMRRELLCHGVQPIMIEERSAPCAGMGGAAKSVSIVDIPKSAARILGLVTSNVVLGRGLWSGPEPRESLPLLVHDCKPWKRLLRLSNWLHNA